jgi:hypothetical protein
VRPIWISAQPRERGELPRHLKFQVCLPTPMGVAYSFCTQRDLGAIEPAYEQAMLREAEAVCRHIPHRDLCIQWDFCNEMVLIDGQPQEQFPTIKASTADIMQRMQRLCEPIPESVELGIHLCYGDFGAKHFIEPIDAGKWSKPQTHWRAPSNVDWITSTCLFQ